jgi:hypothetical protein
VGRRRGAGAVLAAAVGYIGWRLARGISGAASGVTRLPAGAVRDRVFELAKGTATRVRQAYLLPGDCWRLLDVFARPGRSVHLTPEAVDGLGPRERDAVVALELEYLRRQRGERLGLLLMTATAAAAAAAVAVGLITLGVVWHEGVAYLVPLTAVVAVSLTNAGCSAGCRTRRSRRPADGRRRGLLTAARETGAGRDAAAVTGRPAGSSWRARANVTPERLRLRYAS